MDRRRLLIPRVAIRDLAREDTLTHVSVKCLVSACRLHERWNANRKEPGQQQPGDQSSAVGARGQSGTEWYYTASSRAGFNLSNADTPIAPQVSVVVPTYNERTRIAELIAAVVAVFARERLAGELVIVDDNSPDGTGAIVDGLLPHYGGQLQVVHRAGNLALAPR